MNNNDFHTLYDNWVKNGFRRWDKPSIDRIDDYGDYEIPNIQIITWRENKKRGHDNMKNGINNKRSIEVDMLDLNGEFLKSFYSQCQASREMNVKQGHISECCSGKRFQVGGYKWRIKKKTSRI